MNNEKLSSELQDFNEFLKLEISKLQSELKIAIHDRDEANKQLTAVRNEYHAFFRKFNTLT